MEDNNPIEESKGLGLLDLTAEESARALEREKEFAELRKISDKKTS